MRDFQVKLTNQQIFDKVLAHLLKQGKRAVLASEPGQLELCAYRAPDGSKCAAGCLIDDEYYNANLEGRSVDYGPVMEALIASGVPAAAIPLVLALQRAHDHPLQKSVEEWKNAMRKIALSYNLEWKEQ